MAGHRQYCTFWLQGSLFGVSVERVQEVIRCQPMTRVPLAPSAVKGMMNLRGQIVTAVDLRQRMGLPEPAADQAAANVVVRASAWDEAASLLVDEVGEVIEVRAEDLEPPPETLHGAARELVDGVYKLPGQLLLALNVERALELPDAGGANGSPASTWRNGGTGQWNAEGGQTK